MFNTFIKPLTSLFFTGAFMGFKQRIIVFILLTSVCPITTIAAPVAKIVGGKPSAPNQWPWIAALVRNNSADNYQGQFCGASLINPRWLITAAHCLRDENNIEMKPQDLHAVAQILDLQDDIGQALLPKRLIVHPQFNNTQLNHDIALIQLQKPAKAIKPLSLVTGNNLWVNTTAIVIGWGALSEQDANFATYPTHLYNTSLPIVSNALCQTAMGKLRITSTMLCAGLPAGGRDTCSGDSGGPLIVRQNNQWHLAGITSWGDNAGCAARGKYGVYTRVSRYIGFIKNTMGRNYTALADANHDKVINALDKTRKKNDLNTVFQKWLKKCWLPEAACADINTDAIIDTADYNLKNQQIINDYNYWLTVYWQPEITIP